MGEARRRGTYEERRDAAIASNNKDGMIMRIKQEAKRLCFKNTHDRMPRWRHLMQFARAYQVDINHYHPKRLP